MGHADPAADELKGFRSSFRCCLRRWGDTLFELADAVLCSPASVGSVPGLSLEPVFRRSHGSLYKALAAGDVDQDSLRNLMVTYRPQAWPLVYAVDASTCDRCDAEGSPERGFHYSASKHSAGQPIEAGWSYQWISQLSWDPDSWTAPMDALRVTPAMDATSATIDQIKRHSLERGTGIRRRHHTRWGHRGRDRGWSGHVGALAAPSTSAERPMITRALPWGDLPLRGLEPPVGELPV